MTYGTYDYDKSQWGFSLGRALGRVENPAKVSVELLKYLHYSDNFKRYCNVHD